MFFFLSKVLHFLTTPITWILVLFFLGLILKKKSVAKKLLIISFSLFIFFTNPFIFHETMRLWEPQIADNNNLKQQYDYGIVLAGMIYYDDKDDRIIFGRASDRIFQAVELYKKGYLKKIFISGGSGEVFNPDFKEAAVLRRYLILLGIPAEDVLFESVSKNTYENALETAKILKPRETNDSYLLITSASHLRRSAACFKKQGFVFDIYPTDFYTVKRKFTLDMIIVPKSEVLTGWNVFFHEILGYITYKIVGYC